MPAKSYVNANINNWSSGLSKLKQPVQFGTASSGGYTMDPVSIGIAGATAISNIIGGISQKKMQKRALAQQQKQFEEQMAFNERWNQQNFDNENKWRQYDYDWNTMSAQRQRIEDAGMNPALMMGQMSPGFSSSQAAGTGTMSAPNAQTPIVADGLAQSFSRLAGDVGSVLQSFASAGKMDQETKEIRDTLYQKIRGQMLENDQRELALTLDRMYALAERNAGLRQMTADYAKTVAEKVQAYAAGRYYDESALNQLEQSLLAKAKAKLTDKEYEQFVMLMPIVKQQAEEQVTLIQKQQKTEDSKQAANNAAAEESRAGAGLKRQLTRTEIENTRKAHWEKVAASWNALDAKTQAKLNKKFGGRERFQKLVDAEIDNSVKTFDMSNPSLIGRQVRGVAESIKRHFGFDSNEMFNESQDLKWNLEYYIHQRLYDELE